MTLDENGLDTLSYFPEDENRTWSFWEKSFSRALSRMEEPILHKYNTENEVTIEAYRITNMPSFLHSNSLRIQKSENGIVAVHKIFDGQGGYDHGAVFFDKTSRLTDFQWTMIKSVIKHNLFLPFSFISDKIMCDGEVWLMEDLEDNKYEVNFSQGNGNISNIYYDVAYIIQNIERGSTIDINCLPSRARTI